MALNLLNRYVYNLHQLGERMKKSILFIAGMSLLTTSAFAATPDTSSKTELNNDKNSDNRIVHRGFKAFVSRSNVKAEITQKSDNTTTRSTTITGEATSILAGYQYVKTMAPRFSVLAGRTIISAKGDTVYNDILEGNVTFGLNKRVHFASGLHLAQYNYDDTEGDGLFDGAMGAGLQTSASYQFNKFMSLDLKYMMSSFTKEETFGGETTEYNITVSGLQLGLSGTF
jgi:hypothetical protein